MSGNAKSNSKKAADWIQYDFVEISLTKADEAEFKRLYTTKSSELLAKLEELVSDNYKISVSQDDRNACILASLTGRDPQSPNFHNVLTARSNDLWECLALLAYKHFYLADDGDWGDGTRSRSWG